MLESKGSSKDSGSSNDGVSKAELADVQVSGGAIAEVVQEESIFVPVLQPEPEPEPIVEEQLQKQADNLPETIWFAPEKSGSSPFIQMIYRMQQLQELKSLHVPLTVLS